MTVALYSLSSIVESAVLLSQVELVLNFEYTAVGASEAICKFFLG
jgi:hypothetical protein